MVVAAEELDVVRMAGVEDDDAEAAEVVVAAVMVEVGEGLGSARGSSSSVAVRKVTGMLDTAMVALPRTVHPSLAPLAPAPGVEGTVVVVMVVVGMVGVLAPEDVPVVITVASDDDATVVVIGCCCCCCCCGSGALNAS